MQGFCSKCNRAWVLKEKQGWCPWCDQPSSIRTTREPQALRLKSRRPYKQKQVPNGNGYDQLDGRWATYYKVADQHARKAGSQDRGDVLHDIMATLAQVELNRNGDGPLSLPAMHRIASRVVADYWRTEYRHGNGIDCGQCSKAQRRECHQRMIYPAHPSCPRAIAIESLAKPIVDAEGNTTALGELIADDKALDLDAWVDAKTWLKGCPQRLVAIAVKRANGDTLNARDKMYLSRFRQREQQALPFTPKSRYIQWVHCVG